MSDLDATTPRVFLARHGEIEWTINGRYTGTTEVALTEEGIKQVRAAAAVLVGQGWLLDPSRVVGMWVSPRNRAQQTFELLFNNGAVDVAKVEVTEDIREWDYGDYEGLKVGEIRQLRKERGLDADKPWDLWRDGHEGGESAQQVTERLDRLVAQIREIQRPHLNGETPADVILASIFSPCFRAEPLLG